MGEFLQRLFRSDFMPHGVCWEWEPWVVWTNVASDSAIFLCSLMIGTTLIKLAAKRKDMAANRVLVMFGVFIIACGCTHAMEVYNTWHGVFRLSGVIKVVTATISVGALVPLLQILPTLLAAPPLTQVLAMDAALCSEQRSKHRVEEKLRETQDRFRLLVDSIKDYSIIMVNPDGVITSWNPGAERIYGWTREEILGHDLSRFYPPEEVAAGKPGEVLRLAAVQGRMEDESWRLRKDGSRFIANVVITAYYDSLGVLQGFASVARDVTSQRADQAALRDLAESLEDQVKAQLQELRESEARLQGFIRHSPAAISFKGLDGRYLLLNPKAVALFGYPLEDILGRTNEDLFPPENCARAMESDRRAVNLRQDIQEEQHWVRQDGVAFDLIVDKFPLVDATGQCWGLGILSTDISERKRADRALFQSQKLESLGVLVGGIAHDFNNLLGAMQGNVELAMTEASLDLARPYLQTLKGLMAKASGLLTQMLVYAGQGKSSVHLLNLNQLVEEMAHLLGTSISKKVQITLNLHPQLPPMTADPSQVQQVVMNLVLNAAEAMGEQNGAIQLSTGPEMLTQAVIDAIYPGQPLRPGPHVALEVADHGVGMTPEVLKQIFDPFFTTKFTGRGLGLAAILGIVRGHRGGILVVSEPGRGSTFKLLFPATQGPALPVTADAPLPDAPAAEQSEEGAVLVVDDEDDMRAVAVMALRRAGLRTLEARNGVEALDLVQQHPGRVRLILMDLAMPTMDGEEASRELRRRGNRMPILLTSGFNEAEVLRRFEGVDLAGFIQKPFGLGTLVEMVRKVLSVG